MSDQRRQRRGRPKGTGINDWERLLLIASAIEKDPSLKVTTAIKKVGFSDPSVIRRLRDKFKVNRESLMRGALAKTMASARAGSGDRPEPGAGSGGPAYETAEPARGAVARSRSPNGNALCGVHAVADYIAFDGVLSAPMTEFRLGLMRCILPHPGSRPDLVHRSFAGRCH